MANSFREIIDFSKNIPEFQRLQLDDQIALIKGSCIEMLFIKVQSGLILFDIYFLINFNKLNKFWKNSRKNFIEKFYFFSLKEIGNSLLILY